MLIKELQSLGLDIAVQDEERQRSRHASRNSDDDDGSFDNSATYDLGDDVMVEERSSQAEYSVEGCRWKANLMNRTRMPAAQRLRICCRFESDSIRRLIADIVWRY